jgi:uncharacterized protein (DUF488 family)
MQSFDLFSIGHSNIPIERFVGMLQAVAVNMIADVRSTPASRRFPWFNGKALASHLGGAGMSYLPCGDTLGGRPRDASLYADGVADYEAMAMQRDYQAGLDRLLAAASRHRVCIMCAERDPLDCHRCLLVARSLAGRGVAIGHILHTGTIEAHRAIEDRLLEWSGTTDDLFATGQNERLAAAYRSRARAVAYRVRRA